MPSSGSESDSNVDVDTDRKKEQDSGYSSNTDNDTEYLNDLAEQFKEMGPQMSNLSDVTLEMIQTESEQEQGTRNRKHKTLHNAILLTDARCEIPALYFVWIEVISYNG